jgi:V/A-type H+-transporting ATPase subunit I
MRWREAVAPVPMTRLAVVAPSWALREALVRVADSGAVEIERATPAADLPVSEPARRMQRLAPPDAPRLSGEPPDLDAWERDGRADLLAGEAELTGYAADAVARGEVSALVGWAPSAEVVPLARRLAEVGATAVPLPVPRGTQPPTAPAAGPAREGFAPLVRTYATVPYADVDPTVLAGLSYVVMFGAMFGDVGQGALLLACGLLLRWRCPSWLARLRPFWLFVAGAGLSGMAFGLLYGEFFGPTGLVPTAGLSPMEQPVRLLVAGIGLGAVLLAGAYALGTVNRIREGGWSLALYAPSGVAGCLLFLAGGVALLGWWAQAGWVGVLAGLLALAGLVLAFVGFFVGAGGGAGGATQAAVEVFDTVVRLGANVLSFARLAAFGLTHAVLGWIVWSASVGLWVRGPAGAAAAVVVFVLGNAVTFGLEALVAAVQALRLEYYELFSRVFQAEGRPFRPWRVPLAAAETSGEASCSPG